MLDLENKEVFVFSFSLAFKSLHIFVFLLHIFKIRDIFIWVVTISYFSTN